MRVWPERLGHSCLHQRYDVTFHAVVDVNIDGYLDPPDQPSKTKNVACIPW
jgi:hypothetical protein